MTGKEAIEYMDSLGWMAQHLGLEKTFSLLDYVGHPEKKLKFIHVVGTNGKGSTSAMTAEILKNAGYRVGLYTSPYIMEFNERIMVGDRAFDDCYTTGVLKGFNAIPSDDLGRLTLKLKEYADTMPEHPSEFEIITVVAYLYFLEQGCDIVVLEAGMGGALDATNTIPEALVTVITNIGLDHTKFLGDTIEAIAATKAEVIKDKATVVFYGDSEEALAPVKARCEKMQAKLIMPDYSVISVKNTDLSGQVISYKGYEDLELQLTGHYQQKNAAVVLEIITALQQMGWNVPREAVYAGIKDTHWIARMEKIGEQPYIFADGSHNPQGMRATVDTIKSLTPVHTGSPRIICVFGVMADKDLSDMAPALMEVADEVVCVRPDYFRAMDAEVLTEKMTEYAEGKDIKVYCGHEVKDGVQLALSHAGSSDIVLCIGSLYMAADVRNYVLRDIPLEKLRQEIDEVDTEIIRLFEKRQMIAENIGLTKLKNHVQVFDPGREGVKLSKVASQVSDAQNAEPVQELFKTLMDLSKERQKNTLEKHRNDKI